VSRSSVNSFFGIGRAGNAVTFLAQNLLERAADLRFVVNHQDVIHDASLFTVSASSAPARARDRLNQRKAQQKPRALGNICLSADGAAVLLTILAAMERPRPVPRRLVE
jgi:hypothetical protein